MHQELVYSVVGGHLLSGTRLSRPGGVQVPARPGLTDLPWDRAKKRGTFHETRQTEWVTASPRQATVVETSRAQDLLLVFGVQERGGERSGIGE